MKQRVLDPLGLAATVPNERREIIPDRTCFYARHPDGDIVHAPYYDPSFKWAGAGFLSTVEDLARFGMALSAPGFLSAATWSEITDAARTNDGTPIEYALGWDAPQSHESGCKIQGKSGGGPGIRGLLVIYRGCDLVVVMLTNLSRAPVRGELWETVAGAFLAERAKSR
jgi:CubicO group peptidase (beta-lactamase class C family)